MNAAMIVLLLVTAIGCSTSSGSNTPAASSPPAKSALPQSFCSSVASLKSSVRSVKQMKVSGSDLKQLKANLTAVGTAVGNVLSSAKSQYPKEVAAIQHDYESLKSAIDIAVENPSYPTIAQAKTEFTKLWNVVGHFVSTTAAGC